MFSRVQVCALSGPLKNIHRVVQNPLLYYLGCVCRVVDLLENGLQTVTWSPWLGLSSDMHCCPVSYMIYKCLSKSCPVNWIYYWWNSSKVVKTSDRWSVEMGIVWRMLWSEKKEFNPLQEKDCKVTKCGTIEVDALWIQSDQTIKRSVHQGLFTKSISLHCYLFSRWQ